MSSRGPSLNRHILFTTIASLLTVPAGFASDAGFTSGILTGDADSGVSTSKTYTAIANVIGNDVVVNGKTFAGSGTGLSGTGWALSGLGNIFGGGGNKTTTLGASSIASLFDGFQYGGNPGTLTLSGLTPGQTYVATLYQQAWGLPDDRTNAFVTSEGAVINYNSDAQEASMLRYTFVATGGTTTISFKQTRTNYTLHLYGLSNEQLFTNTWTPTAGNSWNTPANWSSGVPNLAGSNASFSAQPGATNVGLSGPTTVGSVQFLGTGSYTVSGVDPLTFQADSGGLSVVKADAGASHTISAPVALNSDLAKFGAGTVTLSGGISGSRAVSVGGGTLRFGSTNSYTGGTTVSAGATLDFNGTSQSVGALSGAGSIVNDTGGNSVVTVDSGTFSGSINDHNSGTGTVSLLKTTNSTLKLTGTSTYSGTTTVSAGKLNLQAGTNALITDNFSATGNPNTNDLNYNLAARQTGSAALQNWTPAGNTQNGNPTDVQQSAGTLGDYLLLAFGASATLNGLPLSTANVPGPLKVSFDMFKGVSTTGDLTDWTSFTMRSAGGNGFPITGSGEFGFLYRQNTGIQIFNNSGLIQDIGSTAGGDSWGFYLADTAGTGSPFANNGTRLIVTQGGSVISNLQLNTGMATSFITFGAGGSKIGGVDNLGVNSFQTNTLAPTTNVSLPTTGTSLDLDAVNQTVASLSGVAGSAVNLGPFSHLTVNGSTSTVFNGTITGTLASLEKNGSSLLELGSANSYSNGTTISGGAIMAHHAAALGPGNVSIAAGANYLAWFNTGTPIIANNFTLNGLGGNPGDGNKSAIYGDGGGNGFSTYLLTGTITLNATSNISGNNANNVAIAGLITGDGGLTKGSGRNDENSTLILGNSSNDYKGDTTVANGTLKLGSSEVIPHGEGKGKVVVNSGATLDLAGNSETINNLSGSGTVTASAGIAIAPPVSFTNDAGTGISATKTYTHALDFGEGVDAPINGVTFTGAATSGTNWSLAGATLTTGNGSTGATGDISRLLTNFYYNGNPATLTLTGLTPGTTYETRLYERAFGGDRTQLFTFTAGSVSGQLVFNEDASTTPNYLSFRYLADASGTATLSTTQLGAGTYHWYGVTNEKVSDAPVLPVLTVGDASDSTFSGSVTSALALTKQGNGILTLSGPNSFSGATTVTGGKLLVTGSLSGTSAVAVNAGTLGGTGTINPAASISVASGAEIAPGVGIGTLSTGPVAFASGSAFTLEIGATTGDKLAVSGAASLSGTVTLNLSLLADPVDSTSFTIIDGSALLTGYSSGARFMIDTNSLDEGELFSVTTGIFTQQFKITYTGGGGNDVILQAVPEPGSAAFLLLGATALFGRRRRNS